MLEKNILARNLIYNFISQAVLLLLRLSTTPYIVHRLGPEAYGIFSICHVIIGFMYMLDLKISSAIIKFISEFYANKNESEVEKVVRTSLSFYLILGSIGALIIAALAKIFVLVVFKIPQHLQELSYTIFYITALIYFIKIRTTAFQSITMALQRFDLYNKVYTSLICIEVLGNIFLLYKGYHLRGILIWNAIIALVQLIIFSKICKRLLPRIKFNPGFDYQTFKKLFSFGGMVVVQDACAKIIAVADKFLIGVFMPIGYLSFYVVPYNISQNLQMVTINFIQVIFPEASGLYGQQREGALKKLYFKIAKYLLIVLFPVASLLTVFARSLLYYWIGPDFAQNSVFSLQMLSISIFLLCFGSLSGLILTAIGKAGIVAKGGIFCLFCNLVLCLLLIPLFKINGAALAFAIAHILLSGLFIGYIHRNVFKIFSSSLLTKGLSKLITLCVFFLLYLIMVKNLVLPVMSILLFCLFGLGIFILIIYLKIFDNQERKLIREHLFLIR